MEVVVLTALIYLLFLFPFGLLAAAAWTRHRADVRVHWADWLLLAVPWGVWFALSVSGHRDKSLSNMVEAVLLGIGTGSIFMVRSRAARPGLVAQARLALASLAASSLIAIAVWALVPALAEWDRTIGRPGSGTAVGAGARGGRCLRQLAPLRPEAVPGRPRERGGSCRES